MDIEWGPSIAVFTALSVVAIILLPCFFFFRGWKFRVLPGCGALVLALPAVAFGFGFFTGWFLVGPGHPNSDDWMGFVILNVIIAAAAGIPGGLAGLVVALLLERSRLSQTPAPAEPAAKPADTAVQRQGRRDRDN